MNGSLEQEHLGISVWRLKKEDFESDACHVFTLRVSGYKAVARWTKRAFRE
ncbi:MAG: hypothetical protein ACLUGQ_08670 [Coprococcus sp.]